MAARKKDLTPPRPEDLRVTRQPGETAKAYHAFCHYRDLPLHNRSRDRAWREHCRDCLAPLEDDPAKPPNMRPPTAPGHWRDWSRKWAWKLRAEIADDRNAERRRQRRIHEREEAQDRIARMASAGLAKLTPLLTSEDDGGLTPEEIRDAITMKELPTAMDRFAATLLRALGDEAQGGASIHIAPSEADDRPLINVEFHQAPDSKAGMPVEGDDPGLEA